MTTVIRLLCTCALIIPPAVQAQMGQSTFVSDCPTQYQHQYLDLQHYYNQYASTNQYNADTYYPSYDPTADVLKRLGNVPSYPAPEYRYPFLDPCQQSNYQLQFERPYFYPEQDPLKLGILAHSGTQSSVIRTSDQASELLDDLLDVMRALVDKSDKSSSIQNYLEYESSRSLDYLGKAELRAKFIKKLVGSRANIEEPIEPKK